MRGQQRPLKRAAIARSRPTVPETWRRPPVHRTDDQDTHLSGTQAGGGKKLGKMRYVLGISMVAIIAVFATLLLVDR